MFVFASLCVSDIQTTGCLWSPCLTRVPRQDSRTSFVDLETSISSNGRQVSDSVAHSLKRRIKKKKEEENQGILVKTR